MTNSRKLEMDFQKGFHFQKIPSLSGHVESLIVILHGHASHPQKYLKWAAHTQKENPNADIIIVRSPVPVNATAAQKRSSGVSSVDDLYTWYAVEKKPRKQVGLVIRHAFNRLVGIKHLNKMIDHQLAIRGLKDKDLAIMGFSMGGAVAVQAGLHRKQECAAVVCHSGVVPPFTKATKKPRTLMIVGERDYLFFLPEKKLPKEVSKLLIAFHKAGVNINLHHDFSVERLKRMDVPVTARVLKRQSHRITKKSWQEASEFVANSFKNKKGP